jgi:hypothetical protein
VGVCRTAVVTAMFFVNVASVILWDEEHYCKESSVEFILKLMYLSVTSFRDVQIDSRLSSRFDFFTVHSSYLSDDSFVPSTYCVCYFRVRTFFVVALMHTPELVFFQQILFCYQLQDACISISMNSIQSKHVHCCD